MVTTMLMSGWRTLIWEKEEVVEDGNNGNLDNNDDDNTRKKEDNNNADVWLINVLKKAEEF